MESLLFDSTQRDHVNAVLAKVTDALLRQILYERQNHCPLVGIEEPIPRYKLYFF